MSPTSKRCWSSTNFWRNLFKFFRHPRRQTGHGNSRVAKSMKSLVREACIEGIKQSTFGFKPRRVLWWHNRQYVKLPFLLNPQSRLRIHREVMVSVSHRLVERVCYKYSKESSNVINTFCQSKLRRFFSHYGYSSKDGMRVQAASAGA